MLQVELPLKLPRADEEDGSYADRMLGLLQGDLGFHGQKSPNIFHSWHAFPAKFPPQLPHAFIAELTQPGDIVFDPMMGSCTTLLEAVALGRAAVGTDIDPLSIRLGQAKLIAARAVSAGIRGHEFLERVRQRLSQQPETLQKALEKRFDEKTRSFVDYWFAPHTQLELIALIREIERIEDPALRAFFTLTFSSIIITKSGGVSMARDLAHTRPHRVTDKVPNSPLEEFGKRLQKNLKNMKWQGRSESTILEANSRKLPLGENSIDLIVTSPPYASNAIDYMRAHKFSLVWLGYAVDHLSQLRRGYIGGDATTGIEYLPMPSYTQKMIHHLSAADAKKGKVLHRYYSEMTESLSEMQRVLRPGCAAIVVVGTSVIRGIDIQIHHCLREIGEAVGFEHVHTGVRQLDRDKRMMPARWNRKNNTGIEARMHEEYVIGFRKPGTEDGR